jgi:hypothetical protein
VRNRLAAGPLDSVCSQPLLVLEERAKQQRNLPMMISLGARRKRTGKAQNVAPVIVEVRSAVERLVQRQFTSNRRHGSHPFDSQSPGDAGDRINLPFQIRSR